MEIVPESKTLTEYERKRLDNIRRNEEMMSALMLQRKAADLKRRYEKKPKPASDNSKPPIVIRCSLRTRGIPPSAEDPPPKPSPLESLLCKRGPFPVADAFVSTSRNNSGAGLVESIKNSFWVESQLGSVKTEGFDARSDLVLRPENIAKVVRDRILSVRFLPFGDRTVVAVGNGVGNLGFWDVDFLHGDDDGGDGVYVYQPHLAPVSGISVHPFSPRKIYTSSHDGLVRLMDVEKESFDVRISSDYEFYAICQSPQDINSLYVVEQIGDLKVWDEREGKVSNFWELHEARINTIDFNPGNLNLMATSSNDGSSCIWDLRSMKKDRPESIRLISHHRPVQSSYFSPSGKYLATTSLDNNVGIASGANFDDLSMVAHNNWTGGSLSISSFRATWGWDDSYIFIGNSNSAVDVISTTDGTTTALECEDMTLIPCRFAAHPNKLGHLAGTSGGKVFLWTRQ